ncbi:GlxA family transcriptional regulator [Prosthecomicrobium hirschii]|uniref:GlxA family transcriptional regulator n=1 Tax=Prosthecodimorpha hirschii TaxID=665126 RepID=UPI0009F9474E|nr:GlxA family transcriptional regulator [Prosthecomicrobium hirschii]
MPKNADFLPESAELAIGFLLLPDFAMMSYACASEPLRAANRLSGRTLYRWRHFSVDGGPVMASSGVPIVPDGRIGDDVRLDALFVFAGGNPSTIEHGPTEAWLRTLARRGVRLGGISGGPFLLARAGLLAGRRATIHWEHLPAFAESFPDVGTTGTVYEIDGDRMTSAGGVAALDMMIELIARDHGAALAAAVGDWFLRSELRAGGTPQRTGTAERLGIADPRLLRVLSHMEANPTEAPSRLRLARIAGLSVRRLEDLFAAHLGSTIGRHALALKLDRARRLLTQSGLSVIEVATACGFQSASHFSRSYRTRFGIPPSADQAGRAGLPRDGPGRERPGREGSGREGPGREGSGRESPGRDGSGQDGSGRDAAGRAAVRSQSNRTSPPSR